MTPEQKRLMAYLDVVDGWVTLFELTEDRCLLRDDDLFVLSLVARGWVDHDVWGGAVRINEAGRAAFERA
ncbi:hypothetical protein M446_5552 [Methylobacterium sp. 4-46]|uniref:hypothetical protein n=1 Tax=unclassified Methylobacterium TaxID=2615210 RepID=UPI000165CE30|nr:MULTISPECIES: hypothetical protein [Methylobacterium]ACA19862.1 hypothetical protein M446_5552 [Methylobacterium sp. 4-46]WFT79044.1 hypothetical protein QA634_27975 [Methylobacterium nodulans]